MTSNHQKNIEEIYYSYPIRQTSSKSKRTREIRKNLKFTPFTHIELNTKYHNDLFINELNDNINEKKKDKKVSFKNDNYIQKKNETERLKEIKSIDIHYDELIEKLRKNPPHIRSNTINLSQEEKFNDIEIKSSKTYVPKTSKFILKNNNYFEKENIENKELKNEENLLNKSQNLHKLGLLLSQGEEKVKNFTNTEMINDFYEYTEKCMSMILDLEQIERNEIKEKINFNFPKNEQYKKIALFDLDETLVHCIGEINSKENKKKKYQNVIEVILPSKKKVNIGINIRPYWKDALNLIKEKYHIIIFTASHQSYANAVLDFMDPKKEFTKYRLYRNHCVLTNLDGVKFYIKDLSIFDKYYNLKDIVLIDNSVLSFAYHLDNGIPIVPYYDADEDGELGILAYYLLSIYNYDDLRNANKTHIRIEFYLDEDRKERNHFENESSYEEEDEVNDMDINVLNSDNNENENNKNQDIKSENNNNNNNNNDNNKNNNNNNNNDNNNKNNNENEDKNNKINALKKVSFATNTISKNDFTNNENKQNFKKKFIKYNTLRDINIFNGYKRNSIRKRTNVGLDIKKIFINYYFNLCIM